MYHSCLYIDSPTLLVAWCSLVTFAVVASRTRKMGSVAPRFRFLLATPFPLLRRRHHHHHHRNLFLLSTHSLPLSSFSFSLKLKASQSQASAPNTSPCPEWSSFLSHISSAGYLPSLPDQAFTAAAERLSYSFLRDATACLAFARDRPNLLRFLSLFFSQFQSELAGF